MREVNDGIMERDFSYPLVYALGILVVLLTTFVVNRFRRAKQMASVDSVEQWLIYTFLAAAFAAAFVYSGGN